MSKSDIYIPSCHIYVQITVDISESAIYMSKTAICIFKLQYLYFKILRPAFVLYTTFKAAGYKLLMNKWWWRSYAKRLYILNA